MTVVRAAALMNTKNRNPQKRPPAMLLKMLGRVMKMRPGPASGVTPKAKQAGKMMRPAVRATKVSRTTMSTDSCVRERSFFR